MKEIKEITVLSVGDSRSLKTWSNVPFLFTKTLAEKGIKINRVNVEENKLLNGIYKFSIFALLKAACPNSNHNYFRSGLNYWLTGLKIKKAFKTYGDSDVFLFLTYSFNWPKTSGKKVVLFSDWTYQYYITNFLGRNARWFEKKSLKREAKHIETADLVLSLFPKALESNRGLYQNKHQYYLGNVINNNYSMNAEAVLTAKRKSRKILFIGNRKYLSGALDLVEAFKILTSKDNSLELHVVGLTDNDVSLKFPGLFCHGYLDKSLEAENELYYRLLSEAKAIVNTTRGWGAFSAVTEAMYYYTPVITSAYDEFSETYGKDIDFGYYVNSGAPEELAEKIAELFALSSEKQMSLMRNAHEQVKDFTWNKYCDRLLHLLQKH